LIRTSPDRSRLAGVTCSCRPKDASFCGSPCGSDSASTTEELAVLGTAADEAIAKTIGRTAGAVRQERRALRVKRFRDRRRA
jgi:hypothetical protein